MSFNLREIPDPDNSLSKIKIFDNEVKALEHIRNHVLTSPECQRWAIIFEYLKREIKVDLGSGDERYRCARQCFNLDSEISENLYNCYADAISDALIDATILGWKRTVGEWTFALGLTGILIIINTRKKCVVSSMVPQFGFCCKEKEDTNLASPLNPLPFEGRLSLYGPWKKHKNSFERSQYTQALINSCDIEKKLYYLVFRPSVQAVRQKNCSSFNVSGRKPNKFVAIRKALPRMSQIKFDEWQKLIKKVKEMKERGKDGAQ